MELLIKGEVIIILPDGTLFIDWFGLPETIFEKYPKIVATISGAIGGIVVLILQYLLHLLSIIYYLLSIISIIYENPTQR